MHFDLTCCSITHVYTIYACTLTSTMYTKGTGTVAPGWVWPRKTMQLATGANRYRHNLLLHTALEKNCQTCVYKFSTTMISDSTYPSALGRLEGVLAFVSQAGLGFQHFKVFSKVARAGKEEIPLCGYELLSLCCACWMHAVHDSMHMDISHVQ